MSGAPPFDANRRLAEVALWTDAGARWIQRAAAQGRRDGRHDQVAVTFDGAELEAFVAGLRGAAQMLLGLAQPVPPPMPASPPARPRPRPRAHLRLVST